MAVSGGGIAVRPIVALLLPTLGYQNISISVGIIVGSVIGFSIAANTLGPMAGSPVGGFMYDAFGNYNAFIIMAAVTFGVAVLLIAIATEKKSLESIKRKEEAMQEAQA